MQTFVSFTQLTTTNYNFYSFYQDRLVFGVSSVVLYLVVLELCEVTDHNYDSL